MGGEGVIKDQNLSREKFEGYSKARSELDVPSLLLKADKVIFNEGSVLELYEQVDKIISDWSGLA